MTNVGLWIDLQKAVIVSNIGKRVVTDFVNSDIDSCRWQLDVWELPVAVRERLSNDKLDRFYKNVSGCVLDTPSLFIFGPGVAKNDLQTRLRVDNYTGTIFRVESAGAMTGPQVVAKVQDHYCAQLAGKFASGS